MGSAKSAYFSEDFFAFMGDLKRHNDRAWFAKNKPRFEEVVQAPALQFISDAGLKLRSLSPQIVAEPKPFGGSLSRIYRDTRFSKDKSPYHTHIGIHFSHKAAGDSDAHLPGFYLHMAPGECTAYAGVWRPEGPALQSIREAIAGNPAAWKKASRGAFKLEGESLKRPPPGFDPGHPQIEDLKRKDFVSTVAFTDKQATGAGFVTGYLQACRAMNPLNAFLAKATGVPW